MITRSVVALVVANSLNPDQDRQNVGPGFLLVLIWIQTVDIQSDSVPEFFFKKLILKKVSIHQESTKNCPVGRVN